MNCYRDPVLVVLLVLLCASLTAFLLDVFPYPFGMLVLCVFIAARVFYVRGMDRPGG